MVNQGPSTGLGELPDASPAVPKIIEATGSGVVAPLRGVDRPSVSESAETSEANAKVPIDATLAPSIDVFLDDLDIPLSALLNAPGQGLDDASRGGENACPPQEKEKGVSAEGTPGDGVASTSSPRFTRFLSDFTQTFSKLGASRTTVADEYLWLYFMVLLSY